VPPVVGSIADKPQLFTSSLPPLALTVPVKSSKAQWSLYVPLTCHCTVPRSENTAIIIFRGSQNKQRLFPCTTPTDQGFFYNRDGMCLLSGTSRIFICVCEFCHPHFYLLSIRQCSTNKVSHNSTVDSRAITAFMPHIQPTTAAIINVRSTSKSQLQFPQLHKTVSQQIHQQDKNLQNSAKHRNVQVQLCFL
jgi:hypothetical protein